MGEITIARVVLTNWNDKENNNSKNLGEFEFLEIPKVGEEIIFPVLINSELSYLFDDIIVTKVIHRPREHPRQQNVHAPSEDEVEPYITLFVEGR